MCIQSGHNQTVCVKSELTFLREDPPPEIRYTSQLQKPAQFEMKNELQLSF